MKNCIIDHKGKAIPVEDQFHMTTLSRLYDSVDPYYGYEKAVTASQTAIISLTDHATLVRSSTNMLAVIGVINQFKREMTKSMAVKMGTLGEHISLLILSEVKKVMGSNDYIIIKDMIVEMVKTIKKDHRKYTKDDLLFAIQTEKPYYNPNNYVYVFNIYR